MDLSERIGELSSVYSISALKKASAEGDSTMYNAIPVSVQSLRICMAELISPHTSISPVLEVVTSYQTFVAGLLNDLENVALDINELFPVIAQAYVAVRKEYDESVENLWGQFKDSRYQGGSLRYNAFNRLHTTGTSDFIIRRYEKWLESNSIQASP